jgi:hypothetical protein
MIILEASFWLRIEPEEEIRNSSHIIPAPPSAISLKRILLVSNAVFFQL